MDNFPYLDGSNFEEKGTEKTENARKESKLARNDSLLRNRKASVFYVAGRRMLNNLMGRNSVPPEVTSSTRSNPGSPSANPANESVFSFKKVFKKRSV